MIEKKIHYCWFGGGEKNEIILSCMDSWRQHLPDYEFIEWNENNTRFTSNFSKQVLAHKKWAFLSDYVRLQALYESGGIYLDTDMFVVRSFDPLLIHRCFLGLQDNGQLNASILGSEKKDGFIKACLDRYDAMEFNEMRLMSMAIPKIITEVYEQYDIKPEVSVYPCEYFYPFKFDDSLKGSNFMESITSQTYAVHLWNASWFTDKELAGFAFEHGEILKGVALFLKYLVKNPSAIINIPFILRRKLFKPKVQK